MCMKQSSNSNAGSLFKTFSAFLVHLKSLVYPAPELNMTAVFPSSLRPMRQLNMKDEGTEGQEKEIFFSLVSVVGMYLSPLFSIRTIGLTAGMNSLSRVGAPGSWVSLRLFPSKILIGQ